MGGGQTGGWQRCRRKRRRDNKAVRRSSLGGGGGRPEAVFRVGDIVVVSVPMELCIGPWVSGPAQGHNDAPAVGAAVEEGPRCFWGDY